MTGGPYLTILFSALVVAAIAAPVAVDPDAVVPEQGVASTIVPEVQAEKSALLGVNTEAKAKSKFGGFLGKLVDPDEWDSIGDGDYDYDYGYGSDKGEDQADGGCVDELDAQVKEQVEAQYKKQLGAAGSFVPNYMKKKIEEQAKGYAAKEMEKKGLKSSCKAYSDAGECPQPQVMALCAKTCDACDHPAPPAGSGAGSAMSPVQATSVPAMHEVTFSGLQIQGHRYHD